MEVATLFYNGVVKIKPLYKERTQRFSYTFKTFSNSDRNKYLKESLIHIVHICRFHFEISFGK